MILHCGGVEFEFLGVWPCHKRQIAQALIDHCEQAAKAQKRDITIESIAALCEISRVNISHSAAAVEVLLYLSAARWRAKTLNRKGVGMFCADVPSDIDAAPWVALIKLGTHFEIVTCSQ
tara:strand:+ start:34820 stop:35179 length:360 start_codon:yes stop_codon:yes gene_type:complete